MIGLPGIPMGFNWTALAIKALIVLVLALALFGFGWKCGADHLQPRLDNATTERGQFEQACKDLRAGAEEQNAGIQALADNATRREAQAAAAMREARTAAQRLNTEAQGILLAPAPAGVDLCLAASAAFDQELAQERRAWR